jgi:GDP-4-dehydro-6-deoxy-D-mannose reductase
LRVLITGVAGFAGGHLARECAAAGDEVFGLSRAGDAEIGSGIAADLRDAAAVREAVRSARPDVVYHLAALSSVGRSWEQPGRTMEENIAGATNLLEAMRLEAPDVRVVWISSCEVYGDPDQLPVSEDAPLRPANPYAVSKCAGDLLAAVYNEAYDMEIIRARPFSHAGPGQRPIFLLSSIAHQAAQARIDGSEHVTVVTGNPQTRRDFTDVRDVVRAYRLLADRAQPGVYNVSSARSVSAAEQVQLLAKLIAPVEVEHAVDPARVRAHEVMDLSGANDRIRATTGWRPEIALEQTMRDTLEWWERLLRESPVDAASESMAPHGG